MLIKSTVAPKIEPKTMSNDLGSDIYGDQSRSKAARPGWFGVGVVAAALVGGLAAAWYYRKTLARLQEAGELADEAGTTEESLEEL